MIRIFIALVPFILSLNANLNAAEDQSTVLITGSNRNIGFEFVKQFANKGWRVIATTRSIDSADELIEFSKENNNVIIEQLDITNDEHLRNLKKKYNDDVIDVLLNNAAYTPRYLSSFRGIDGVDHEATRKSFEKARNKLVSGRGNLVKRAEALRELAHHPWHVFANAA